MILDQGLTPVNINTEHTVTYYGLGSYLSFHNVFELGGGGMLILFLSDIWKIGQTKKFLEINTGAYFHHPIITFL